MTDFNGFVESDRFDGYSGLQPVTCVLMWRNRIPIESASTSRNT